MVKVGSLRSVSPGRFELETSDGAADTAMSPRKDLVLIEPAEPVSPHTSNPRPQANFLAQLLAVAHRAPQTLEKRRAEPQEASDRYAAAGKAVPARPGRSLKRAV